MNTHKYFSASFEIFPLNAKGEVVTDQSKNKPSLEELEAIANEGSGEVQGQSSVQLNVPVDSNQHAQHQSDVRKSLTN